MAIHSSLLLLGRGQTSARENAASRGVRVLQKNSWRAIPQEPWLPLCAKDVPHSVVNLPLLTAGRCYRTQISDDESHPGTQGRLRRVEGENFRHFEFRTDGRYCSVMSPAGIKKLSPHALDGLSNDESASITRRKDRVNAVCLVILDFATRARAQPRRSSSDRVDGSFPVGHSVDIVGTQSPFWTRGRPIREPLYGSWCHW
ncbi:hypothetical protein EDB83DRAFT_1706816 [Lactarius deliciosus]|nr:hypothetical protein EDB83DRAFT_1706816 [Lactarius deliciosus]